MWAPRLAPRRSRTALALGYAVTAAGTLAPMPLLRSTSQAHAELQNLAQEA